MKAPVNFGEYSSNNSKTSNNRLRVRKIVLTVACLLIVGVGVYALTTNLGNINKAPVEGKRSGANANVTIIRQWDLPASLREISGLSYINGDRFACVQDELGSIFIFNTGTSSIEREINFGGAGDYEGLAVVNNSIWVLRADGKLFEVANALSNNKTTTEHKTFLKKEQDCEGLCYDQANNRLLVTVKEKDPFSSSYKGIYAFDLSTKQLLKEPVYKLENGSSKNGKKQSKKGNVMPSGIAIHPGSKEIYITDGPSSRLVVLDNNGEIKNTYQLDKKSSPQPEGITFNSSGQLFISNEGPKNPGNILQIRISE